MYVTRRWYYFIPASGEPRGLVHRIESGVLNELPGKKAVYSGWQEQETEIRKLLGGSTRVAMQYSPRCAVPYVAMVDAGTIELVRSAGADVVSSAELIQEFEAALSDEQFQTHTEAGVIVDRIREASFRYIGDRLASGVGEYEVQQWIRAEFARAGLITDSGPIVAANGHAGDPHYEPTPETSSSIRPGDFVLLDMWAKFDRPGAVYYDITWTGHCGEPSSRIKDVFGIVRDARDAAVHAVAEAVSAGRDIRGFQVDDAAREHIRSNGFGEYFVHRTGHSIGTDVHGTGANMDNLETHDDRRILPGSLFSVEPGIYLPEFGIRSEVDMFVDETSARVTGEIQRELVVI